VKFQQAFLNYGLWQPKKKIRKHFGYTQKDIGEMLYISASANGKKESPAKQPLQNTTFAN